MANPIRELVVKVSVDADTKGFDDLNDAQEKTSTKSVALGNIIADMAGRLVDAAVAAAKYGAALINDIVAGSIEAADAIAKNADQLAVSAEQLQRLSGAAKRTGTDVSGLDAGVRTLTKGLGDAALKGTGPVADAFGTLGLEVDEVSSLLEAGDIEDALGLISDAFNETADSAEKNAALLKIFGGSGAQLRPLLSQGSEGIKELGDDVRNVIRDEDLDQFEALADANLRVEEEVEALERQIAAGLAPSLEIIAGRVSDFISENEELITQDLPTFLAEVGQGLIDLTQFVFDTIESWREFIREIDNAIERFKMDFPEATGFMRDALALVGQVADDVGGKIREVVEFILNAVSKIEGLESKIAGIRAGLGLDDEPRAARGAPKLLGGGPNIARPESLTPDNSAKDLQKIIDGDFSESDKSLARASLTIAKQREVAEAATKAKQTASANPATAVAALEAQLAATRNAGERRLLEERLEAARAQDPASRSAQRAAKRAETEARREREARKRARGGGGGGGGGAKAPTVDELIAGAVGLGGGGGPSRAGGGSALAGTNLITVDNSITINNGPVSVRVEVPQTIAEQGTPQELGGFVRSEVQAVLAERDRIDFDRIRARRNVGGG